MSGRQYLGGGDAAKKFHLGNLVAILDYNHLQKMGSVYDIMEIDTWEDKWRSFGWNVMQTSGHDVDALCECFAGIRDEGIPHIVLAETVKGHGVSVMEHDAGWHWRLPARKELKTVVRELGISEEELLYAKSLYQ